MNKWTINTTIKLSFHNQKKIINMLWKNKVKNSEEQ